MLGFKIRAYRYLPSYSSASGRRMHCQLAVWPTWCFTHHTTHRGASYLRCPITLRQLIPCYCSSRRVMVRQFRVVTRCAPLFCYRQERPTKFEPSCLCASVTTVVHPPTLNQSSDLLRRVTLPLPVTLRQAALSPRCVCEVGGEPHGSSFFLSRLLCTTFVRSSLPCCQPPTPLPSHCTCRCVRAHT